MSKAFGILAIALGVWVAVEVYTKGVDQALGGAFAFLEDDSDAKGPPRAPLLERVEGVARGAQEEGADRVDRMLGD
jgi:hypothetical protein